MCGWRGPLILGEQARNSQEPGKMRMFRVAGSSEVLQKCCSMLQCVAHVRVCCSECCSMLQCECCSMLQCVAHVRVWEQGSTCSEHLRSKCSKVLQMCCKSVAVCCSALQCVSHVRVWVLGSTYSRRVTSKFSKVCMAVILHQ